MILRRHQRKEGLVVERRRGGHDRQGTQQEADRYEAVIILSLAFIRL